MTADRKTAVRCHIKAYVQPFERALALEELSRLTESRLTPIDGDLSTATTFEAIASGCNPKDLVQRLAYWERVSGEVTRQCLREATVNIVRNGIDLVRLRQLVPLSPPYLLPSRRCLRYGPHGIHEYRGKFFPQLVVSLLNLADVPSNGIVLDPMSGSGTTPVEAILAGCQAFSLDLNPLSVLLGSTKCELVTADPVALENAYDRVKPALLNGEYARATKLRYFRSLPRGDQEYLSSWFSEDVLQSLDEVSQAVQAVNYAPARHLMQVSLSNILRRVSWQKEDDLRVRKDIRLDIEVDPIKEFLEELGRSVRAVLALLYQDKNSRIGRYDIRGGDARGLAKCWPRHVGRVDAVITSPPYATALPYLDTDRLSLCYLGLLPRSAHRATDYDMIGNREVTERLRKQYLEALGSQKKNLPESIATLIARIGRLNSEVEIGFRRRNLPALLAKYFLDMRTVIDEVRRMLKPGGTAFFVVGSNHTIAGERRVEIPTAHLLNELAESLDFEVARPLSMEMLVSRDIFRKNASDSEQILAWKKKS